MQTLLARTLAVLGAEHLPGDPLHLRPHIGAQHDDRIQVQVLQFYTVRINCFSVVVKFRKCLIT